MKPTKDQVKEAIYYYYGCDSLDYDYRKKQFEFIVVVEFPHYDSGGSMDAIDCTETVGVISWKEALRLFRDYKKVSKNLVINIPEAVYSNIKVDMELPF